MAAIKTPQCQPLVENSAKRIYVTGYEVPCMNEHLEIDFPFHYPFVFGIYRNVFQDEPNNGLNC